MSCVCVCVCAELNVDAFLGDREYDEWKCYIGRVEKIEQLHPVENVRYVAPTPHAPTHGARHHVRGMLRCIIESNVAGRASAYCQERTNRS